MLRAIYFLFFSSVFVQSAAAGPDKVSIMLGSAHINSTVDYNEFNPGVFVTWDRGRRYTIGAFKNSYSKTSVAAMVAWPLTGTSKWTLDATAGIAFYHDDAVKFPTHWGSFVPIAGLQFRTEHYFIQMFPGDGDVTDMIFSFGLSFPLNP